MRLPSPACGATAAKRPGFVVHGFNLPYDPYVLSNEGHGLEIFAGAVVARVQRLRDTHKLRADREGA